MTATNFTKTHPVVIFWLGLLTGAIIVALTFMINNSRDVMNNLLRTSTSTTTIQRAPTSTTSLNTTSLTVPQTTTSTTSYGGPQPLINGYGGPQPLLGQ